MCTLQWLTKKRKKKVPSSYLEKYLSDHTPKTRFLRHLSNQNNTMKQN